VPNIVQRSLIKDPEFTCGADEAAYFKEGNINVQTLSSDTDLFKAVAEGNCQLNWFALADAAQHKGLPSLLQSARHRAQCLLCSSPATQITGYAPHLIELSAPSAESNSWKQIFYYSKKLPCITLIATQNNFDILFDRLSNCCEVKMPDGEVMYLAFWDPAILGVLMGQIDDDTLHIKGPVMNSEQKNWMTEKMAHWWYWDRNGCLHEISVDKKAEGRQESIRTLTLTQSQVDDLVEASSPDQILFHLCANQPKLIENILPSKRYEFVRRVLSSARELGLESMQDLVNFSCISLIYGERLQSDIGILNLLQQVKEKKIKLFNAINLLPD